MIVARWETHAGQRVPATFPNRRFCRQLAPAARLGSGSMSHRADGALWRASTATFSWAASLLALVLSPALASADPYVVKVEEDWELVLLEPDTAVTGPQLTCTMAPTASPDALRVAFDVNHASVPSFSSGGMQLQVWQGEQCVSSKR